MIMICDFPLPLHGMSQVNQFMYEILVQRGIKLKLVNTAPSYLEGRNKVLLKPVIKILHRLFYCTFKLIYTLSFDRSKIVYRAINGGNGQVYDLLYLFICRLFRRKIFIHHHSYAYLNRRNKIFLLLVLISGSNAKHIVLSKGMGERLSQMYSIKHSALLVLSNLSFFSKKELDESCSFNDDLVIGHLSNLNMEKGVGTFVELCRELKKQKVPFRAIIAGPFSDQKSEAVVTEARKNIPEIEYAGPLYGEEKDEFFSKINVFVFPSQYKNEAEPLVIYEAAQQGVYLVTSQVGCLKEMTESFGGLSYENVDTLVDDVVCAFKKHDLLQINKQKSVEERTNDFNLAIIEAVKSRNQVIDMMTKDIVV